MWKLTPIVDGNKTQICGNEIQLRKQNPTLLWEQNPIAETKPDFIVGTKPVCGNKTRLYCGNKTRLRKQNPTLLWEQSPFAETEPDFIV